MCGEKSVDEHTGELSCSRQGADGVDFIAQPNAGRTQMSIETTE